jgi:hypothetical protein
LRDGSSGWGIPGVGDGTLERLMVLESRGYDVYLVSLIRYADQRVCCGAPLTTSPLRRYTEGVPIQTLLASTM